jgi:hypothetical protein
MRDLRQRFFTSVFPKLAAQLISDAIVSFWILQSHHFRQRYRGDLRFELLSVNGIKIATLSYARIGNKCSL